MSNKKQTAVEWVFDNLNICFDKFDNGEYSYTEFINASNEIKEQAKEMHKEEIIEFTDNYVDNCVIPNENMAIPTIMDVPQYYKETYEQ